MSRLVAEESESGCCSEMLCVFLCVNVLFCIDPITTSCCDIDTLTSTSYDDLGMIYRRWLGDHSVRSR